MPQPWKMLILFHVLLSQFILPILCGMPSAAGGGGGGYDTEVLLSNWQRHDHNFKSCTHARKWGRQFLAYVLDRTCQNTMPCCNFRSLLTQGLSSQMASMINLHLDNIQTQIHSHLNWNHPNNSTHAKQNSLALVMVQQLLISMSGGNFNDPRISWLQDNIAKTEGRLTKWRLGNDVTKIRGALGSTFMPSYNHSTMNGSGRWPHSPHGRMPMAPVNPIGDSLQTMAGAPMPMPMPVMNAATPPGSPGPPTNSGGMPTPALPPMTNTDPAAMAAMEKIMAAAKTATPTANLPPNPMAPNPMASPPMASGKTQAELLKLYEDTFRPLKKSQIFLSIQAAFNESGTKHPIGLNDLLKYFETKIGIKKASTDAVRFKTIFSKGGGYNFKTKKTFKKILKLFADPILFEEWLKSVGKHAYEQQLANQPKEQRELFEKFIEQFEQYAFIDLNAAELFYLLFIGLQKVKGELDLQSPTDPAILEFIKFMTQGGMAATLNGKKGKGGKKKAKAKKLTKQAVLTRVEELLFPRYQVFTQKDVFLALLKFFEKYKDPSITISASIMEKFIKEVEALKTTDPQTQFIDSFGKFMRVMGRFRSLDKTEPFFDRFEKTLALSKSTTPPTAPNCSPEMKAFITALDAVPKVATTASKVGTDTECKTAFGERYNAVQQFYRIDVFANFMKSAYATSTSTPISYDYVQFDKFIDEFEKGKASSKTAQQAKKVFDVYLKPSLAATDKALLEMYDIVASGLQRMADKFQFDELLTKLKGGTITAPKTEDFAKIMASKFKKTDDFLDALQKFFESKKPGDGATLLKDFLKYAERVKSEYVGLLISFKTKICDAFGCDSVTPKKNNTKQNYEIFKKALKGLQEYIVKGKDPNGANIKLTKLNENFAKLDGKPKSTFDESTVDEILEKNVRTQRKEDSFYFFLKFFLLIEDDGGKILEGHGREYFKIFLQKFK